MKFVIPAVFICLCVGFINADHHNLAKRLRAQNEDEVIASVLDNSTDAAEINNEETKPQKEVELPNDAKEEPQKPEEQKKPKVPELSVKQKYNKAMEEMREGELYYDPVWRFMEIVNNVTDFKMVNPILTPFDDDFKRPENETHLNDLQIFYEGGLNHIGGGHFVCVYYDAKLNTAFVYDSLRYKILSERTRKLIDLRYLKPKINFIKPRTKQPDSTSCGVFATAYATAIIFGRDPAKVPFKIDHKEKNKSITLRRHLAKILAHNRLKMFPSK